MKKNIAKKYRPYPAYKDSGVEWLEKIPKHWQAEINKWLFKNIDRRSTSGEEELLTVSHITGITRRSEKPEVTMIEAESCEGYKLCADGDLVINTMWAWMGALGIAHECGIISPSYNTYSILSPLLSGAYYDYLCRIPLHIHEIIRHSKGIWRSRLRLYPDEFRLITTPIPLIREQEKIVVFLDCETVKIDTLLAKYQRLLDLLEEKRSALISKAVTKGLDSDVPMRDSGVEWLGKIAQAWNVRRIKYIIHLNPESLSENTNPNYIFQYIDIGSVDNKGNYLPSQEISFESAPSRARRVISEGDIIISTVRTYLRAIALIKKNDIPQVASTGFAVLRCKDYIEPRFLKFALSAPYFIDKVVANSEGIGYPSINESLMSSFNIVYPSIKEQIAIVDFLNRETAKIDSLVAKVEQAVELLKEYRIALISAAVTGKIDLREESA